MVKQDLDRPEYCDGDRSVVSVFSMVLSVIRNGWFCLWPEAVVKLYVRLKGNEKNDE